ncbi:hypothetical protein [Desmonostoc muscorum]|uniref:hypothetical protein n=1 Tax=Desmonostoc muscorum TaxID=1179 RepID=UPI001F2FA5BF|nr:hypothetical protein [Desmonostoc muscorum]MDZ8061203.1 hypothetical protein [Nostoc sp. EkiNYC01]
MKLAWDDVINLDNTTYYDLSLKLQNKSITILSAWIIEEGSDVPRLTTCYSL